MGFYGIVGVQLYSFFSTNYSAHLCCWGRQFQRLLRLQLSLGTLKPSAGGSLLPRQPFTLGSPVRIT